MQSLRDKIYKIAEKLNIVNELNTYLFNNYVTGVLEVLYTSQQNVKNGA